MDICAREGCETQYDRKTHNQKYCSDDCCKKATNSRLTKKYHANKKRKSGILRLCSTCHETKLSRYNVKEVCSACEVKKSIKTNNDVMNMLLKASS